MKLLDFLEKDKDRVLAGLRGAATPADAQAVVEKEADRLLLQYNEECDDARARDAAAGMVGALRSSAPFLDSVGEVQVWQRDGAEGAALPNGRRGGGFLGRLFGGGSDRRPGGGFGPAGKGASRILFWLGAALTAGAFLVPSILSGGMAAVPMLLRGALFPVAGGACLYLAGRTGGTDIRIGVRRGEGRPGLGRGSGSGEHGMQAGRRGATGPDAAIGYRGDAAGPGGGGSRRIEILVDPDKLWHSLVGAVMDIDRKLEDVLENAAADRRAGRGAEAARGLSAEEIAFFSSLLESADADSPQMASDIRYFLHKKGVEALDWSERDADWFEMLPAAPGPAADGERQEAVTIRPALAQDGKLLKKGIAAR